MENFCDAISMTIFCFLEFLLLRNQFGQITEQDSEQVFNFMYKPVVLWFKQAIHS